MFIYLFTTFLRSFTLSLILILTHAIHVCWYIFQCVQKNIILSIKRLIDLFQEALTVSLKLLQESKQTDWATKPRFSTTKICQSWSCKEFCKTSERAWRNRQWYQASFCWNFATFFKTTGTKHRLTQLSDTLQTCYHFLKKKTSKTV